jgi:hypothetical protein
MAAKPIFREQQIYAARHNVLRWSMYQPDGKTPVGIATEDVVRFKLREQDSGALRLDLSSKGSAASRVVIDVLGTTGTTPASGTVLIGESDTTNDDVGVYEGELILIDASEAEGNRAKPFGRGEIRIVSSAGGSIGLT